MLLANIPPPSPASPGPGHARPAHLGMSQRGQTRLPARPPPRPQGVVAAGLLGSAGKQGAQASLPGAVATLLPQVGFYLCALGKTA